MVIGTSAEVYPAAGYVEIARSKGARVAVVNVQDDTHVELQNGDYIFRGDAAIILPELFAPMIGGVSSYRVPIAPFRAHIPFGIRGFGCFGGLTAFVP